MEPLLKIFLLNFALATVLMFCLWIVSLIKKDAGIADIFWGTGFVLIVWLTYFLTEGHGERKLIIVSLTTIWGLRLFLHIFIRNWNKEEDRRYQAMRQQHGERFWLFSLYAIYGFQVILMWLISLVIQIGQFSQTTRGLTWLDLLGICIWIVGFIFEVVGDWQLSRFKVNPLNKGKVMKQGLWAYTRHPNYFGESLIWWGIFLIVLSNPHGMWAIISPIVITFILLKVSGVTLLEKTIVETRPEYKEYIETTNAFIPWFPRSKKQ